MTSDKSQPAAAAPARFLTIWRLSSSILGASSASLALSRKASSPPRWSTLLSALVEMRARTRRPSASEISVTFCKFGMNRRLVLMLEWLTLWPESGFLPVRSHRQDMAYSSIAPAQNQHRDDHSYVKMAGRIERGAQTVKPSAR